MSTTAPIPISSDARDDDPVVELVVDAAALEELAEELQANASLFAEGANCYEAGVKDTVEAIRELAQRRGDGRHG